MSACISVVIPVYNRVRLAERAVASVLSQSFSDYELIVVDDGSIDNFWGSKLHCTILKHGRCLRLEVNRGVSAARNRGIAAAQGRWIAFLDSDDEWQKDKLARQVDYIKRYPRCAIVQTNETWIRKGRRVNPPQTHQKQAGDIFPLCVQRCMITPSSVMIRRDVLQQTGVFNESLPACEDYDLWLRISAHYPVGLVVSEELIRYGGHSDQLSATTPVQDRYRVRSLLTLLRHNQLSADQQHLVYNHLRRLSGFIALGAKKRGNTKRYETYQAIAQLCFEAAAAAV
jgi:glycosyltransferase involved in cell wall biosynthesis